MDEIWNCLKEVYDPELGVNIVDLGLVYDLQFEEGKVSVIMTLTTPGCPMHDTIVGGVKRALEALPEVDSCQVDVVWEPAWSPSLMSDEAKESLGYM
ncbi:MAG: metal-sulfur cluster assembly factor [Gorillibacterium sp.]|nr:metal-sulfur cluster assembly factor [Gorillibacterium sp.]